jgi:hypothetical protein
LWFKRNGSNFIFFGQDLPAFARLASAGQAGFIAFYFSGFPDESLKTPIAFGDK